MSQTFDPYHKWLGIPPHEQPPNHYRLLGLAAFESDRDVIQMGVDRQMMMLRSLQSGKHSSDSQRILSEISAAKLCLLEPDSKADYDQTLHAQLGLAESSSETLATESPSDETSPLDPKLPPRPGQSGEPLNSEDAEDQSSASVPPRPGQDSDVENVELDGDEAESPQALPVPPAPPEVTATQPAVAVFASTSTARNPRNTAAKSSSMAHQARRRKKKSSWLVPVTLGLLAVGVLATVVYVITADKDDGLAKGPENEHEDSVILGDSSDADSSTSTNPPRKSTDDNAQSAGGNSNTDGNDDDAIPNPGDFVSNQPNNSDGDDAKPTGDPKSPPEPADPVVTDPVESVVYLDGLQEIESRVFPTAKLGKNGATGFPQGMPQECRFQGKSISHALSMHPPSKGTSHVVFELAGSYHDFRATAGLLEKLGRATTGVPIVFKVIGDGRVLWTSLPVQQESEAQSCQVSVRGVQLLRLEVDCPGVADSAWAAWINPRLTAADRPGSGRPAVIGSVVSKRAVPDDAAQKQARLQITRLFREPIAQARTPELKLALAQKMLERAKTASDSAERFMLFDRVADLTARAGDVKAAVDVVDTVSKEFKVDKLEMKAVLLGTVGQNSESKQQNVALVLHALALLDEAVLADRYETAQRIGSLALTAARKTRESLLIKHVVDRNDETEVIAGDYSGAAQALEELKSNPSHSDANQVAGRFLCLVKGDWDAGLPLLAKGTVASLKDLANVDTEGTVDPDARVKLGNGWWELAQEENGLVKKNLELRAAQWYRLALVGLAGEAKQQVESRVAEIEEKNRALIPEQVAKNDPMANPDKRPKDAHEQLGYALKAHPKDATAFNGHWYKLFEAKVTWREAQLRCQKLGGYLVCVGSDAEAKFIAKQTETRNTDRFSTEEQDWMRVWLGAIRTPSGQWRWINGERNGFSFWATSQPDNGLGNENRLMAGDSARWHDAPDAAQNVRGFICEWEF
jgi:hypothetical protein